LEWIVLVFFLALPEADAGSVVLLATDLRLPLVEVADAVTEAEGT